MYLRNALLTICIHIYLSYTPISSTRMLLTLIQLMKVFVKGTDHIQQLRNTSSDHRSNILDRFELELSHQNGNRQTCLWLEIQVNSHIIFSFVWNTLNKLSDLHEKEKPCETYLSLTQSLLGLMKHESVNRISFIYYLPYCGWMWCFFVVFGLQNFCSIFLFLCLCRI